MVVAARRTDRRIQRLVTMAHASALDTSAGDVGTDDRRDVADRRGT